MAKFRYVSGWRKNDPALERDVIGLWRAANALPRNVAPEERAKQICCLAYDGKQLAGISTIDIKPYRPLRNKRFGFLRVFTPPVYEGQEIAIGLATNCRDTLRQWSIDHPEAELAGMAAIYQSPKLGKYPVGKSGLTLIGYTPEGNQVTVVWFNHLPV